MAVKCFCGCGRSVGRWPLGVRSVNHAGQDVTERLAWARAVFGDHVDADWADEGDRHIEAIRYAVHGISRELLDVSEVQRWQAYGREMEVIAVQQGLPPILVWLDPEAHFALEFGRWARESGLSDDEAIAEITRRGEAGEPMPWDERLEHGGG
jgi:hypothetical protein